jgi:hypothetical protein
MNIDIDQLHDVIEGRKTGRSVGVSTAELVLMAQSAELLPNGTLAYIYAPESGHPRELFREILDSLDLYTEVDQVLKDMIRFKNGCKVYFLTMTNMRIGLIGKRLDNVFIDPFAEKKLKADDFVDLGIRLTSRF